MEKGAKSILLLEYLLIFRLCGQSIHQSVKAYKFWFNSVKFEVISQSQLLLRVWETSENNKNRVQIYLKYSYFGYMNDKKLI